MTLNRNLERIVGQLVDAGYTAQTSVTPYAGAREVNVWRPSRHPGGLGPNAVIRVGAASGRITGAVVQAEGEDGPTARATGVTNTLNELAALLDVPRPDPAPGTWVFYAGSHTDLHGRYRVLGTAPETAGYLAGRVQLEDTAVPGRVALTVSAGNRSLHPVS